MALPRSDSTPPRRKFLGLRPHSLRRLIIAVGVIGLLGAILFGREGLWKTMVLKRQVLDLERRNDSLAQENRLNLERAIRIRAGDSLAIETEARRYGLVKPGEKTYRLEERPAGSK
ncbi:MAG: hypothetical protein FJY67_03390 [Calditrichaeota bacterium]|nr:hypothetical protein [Calditrichota bacterium]